MSEITKDNITYSALVNTKIPEPMLECLYSYAYLYVSTTSAEMCEKKYKKINCQVERTFYYNFSCSPIEDRNFCNIIRDNVYNNIIICFGMGNPKECENIDVLLVETFCDIYKFLLSLSDYNSIHIIGHSMGGSVAIMFTYLIMIIEKIKETNDMTLLEQIPLEQNPAKLAAPYYNTKITAPSPFQKNIPFDFESRGRFNYTLAHNKDNSIQLILDVIDNPKTRRLIINQKLKIMISGSFPVLFHLPNETGIDTNFRHFIDYYSNRFIHFINSNYGEPNISIDNRDFDVMSLNTRYPITEFSNYIMIDIDTFDTLDMNNLPNKTTTLVVNDWLDPENYTKHRFPIELHHLRPYMNKIKKHIIITGIDDTRRKYLKYKTKYLELKKQLLQ